MGVSRQTIDRAFFSMRAVGLKLLSDADRRTKLKKYTNVPAQYIPHTKFDDKTSNGLTACIIHWLTLHNHHAKREGTGDVHAVIAGRHCSIQVRIGRDKMSVEQKQTRDDAERAGGYYFIAWDFQSFYEWYNDFTRTI